MELRNDISSKPWVMGVNFSICTHQTWKKIAENSANSLLCYSAKLVLFLLLKHAYYQAENFTHLYLLMDGFIKRQVYLAGDFNGNFLNSKTLSFP